jgi:hypothetical protein
MVVSYAHSTEALKMGQGLPAIGPVVRTLDVSRIPDPFQLQIEGIGLKSDGDLPDGAVFDWCERAHDCLSFLAATDPSRIWIWQEQIPPILLSSDFLKRCRGQAQGYPGDFLTVRMMYDRIPRSKNRFGRAVDAWSMDQPFPKAVRNRCVLVHRFLQKVRSGFGNAPISVLSLGCGSAVEIFDPDEVSNVWFTVVDVDQGALDHVQRKAVADAIMGRIRTMKADVFKIAARDRGELPDNYAACCCLGLIDNLSDELVVRLLDLIHSKLAPSGSMLFGSAQPRHRNAALFEHALNWPLPLRSKLELLRLVQKSKFAGCPITVASEPEGVQLFVECKRVPGPANARSGVRRGFVSPRRALRSEGHRV